MGVYGALFCKLNILWAKTFRGHKLIKRFPIVEVLLVVLTTATVGWYNPYTKRAGTRLVADLLSECSGHGRLGEMCPHEVSSIPHLLKLMGLAMCVKIVLTIVTFGMKIPAGIFIPTMVFFPSLT